MAIRLEAVCERREVVVGDGGRGHRSQLLRHSAVFASQHSLQGKLMADCGDYRTCYLNPNSNFQGREYGPYILP